MIMSSPRQLPTHSVRFPITSLIFAILFLIAFYGCLGEDSVENLSAFDTNQTHPPKVAREDTVIFDLGGNVIPDPHSLNPLVSSPQAPGYDSVHGNLCLL